MRNYAFRQFKINNALLLSSLVCNQATSGRAFLLLPGVGKTHLAVGLARKAAESGYRT